MADKIMKIDLSYIEKGDASGIVVNVYDTYANALAYGATGLVATLKPVNALDETIGAAISQVAGETGIETDINGKLLCSLDDAVAEYWGMCKRGRATGPIQILMT